MDGKIPQITFGFLGLILLLISVNYLFSDKKGMPVPYKTPQQTKQINYTYKNITSSDLNQMLAKKDFFFVNVHTPYAGEIAGTDAFIPYDSIRENLDKFPKDKNAKVVFYCRSGMMSDVASQRLNELGYTNVYNLSGGMNDWTKQGYPLLQKQTAL